MSMRIKSYPVGLPFAVDFKADIEDSYIVN